MQPQDTKVFAEGGMDLDSGSELVQSPDWREAWNLRCTGTSQKEAGYITNIESTVLVTGVSRPAGINKCIGVQAFEDIQQAIAFIYNSAGNHQLILYDYVSNTETLLFQDLTASAGVGILNLDPTHYVTSIILVNQTYIVFTDGFNGVGYFNLKTLQIGGYGTVVPEDFSLIKPQGLPPITASYDSDLGRAANFIKGKLFQFNYQYVNADFNFSAWSTWSKRIIPAQESTPTVGTDVTSNNCIVIRVNIGSNRTVTVNIAAKYDGLDYGIIKSVDREYVLGLPNVAINISGEVVETYNPSTNIYSFVFYNDSITIPVPAVDTDLAFERVSRTAGALELLNGNIIGLGDLKEGYPRPSTYVQINAVGYDPNLTVPTPPSYDPLHTTYINGGASGSGLGDHKRYVQINFLGLPKTGDIITIVLSDIRDANNILTYTYTVPSGDNNLLLQTIGHVSSGIPNSSYRLDGASPQVILSIVTPSYFGLRSATVTLFNAGASISKSIHGVLDNSSYQLALSYRDAYGRYYPLSTDNRYIISTPSFAQLNGQAVSLAWTIFDPPPLNAVDAQWVITNNGTTENLVETLANPINYIGTWNAATNDPTLAANTGTVGDTYQVSTPSVPTLSVNLGNGVEEHNTGDYVIYNGKSWDIVTKDFGDLTGAGNLMVFKLNPLNLFNQKYTNLGANTVLNYDFTENDRCTLHYYLNSTTPVYINNPCVDLQVLGYDPGTFLVKMEKSATFDPATIAGKNVYLRLWTPKQKGQADSNVQSTTVWYEIGERITITNGQFDATQGIITDGDIYLKTRQMQGAVDPNTLYSLISTDFNFSDFYKSNYTSYGRPRSYNDVLEESELKASIRWSQNYILGSRNNGLTRFYAENIYGDGDGQTSSSYGAIQFMWQRNNVLVVGQELHTGYVPVNTSIIEDQIEQKQVGISQRLLNNIRYNETGKIGCGTAKESFWKYRSHGGFIDPHTAEPMRIGLEGISSMAGKMSKYFKKVIQDAYSKGLKLVQFYNVYYEEVILAIQTPGGVLVKINFTPTDWNPNDDMFINLGDAVTVASHGYYSASYNPATGIATFTPSAGYVGTGPGDFLFNWNGGPRTKNSCLEWTAGSNVVNDFIFNALTDQPLSTLLTSNLIAPTGNTIPVAISISGGGSPQYSINGGAWTSSAGTFLSGQTVQVRLTSSGSVSTTLTATLTIGTKSAGFSVTTQGASPTSNFKIYNNSMSVDIASVVLSGAGSYSFPQLHPGQSQNHTVTAGSYTVVVTTGAGGTRYIACTGEVQQSGGAGFIATFTTVTVGTGSATIVNLTDTP